MQILLDNINIALIITAALNFILGVIIFVNAFKLSGNKRRLNLIYCVNIIAILLWVIGMFFYRSAPRGEAIYWCIILYLSPTFIASTWLYFSYVFPTKVRDNLNLQTTVILGLNLAIVILLVIPKLIILEVNVRVGMENEIIFSKYYFLYFLYISSFFTYGFIRLFKRFGNSFGIEKLQILYFTTGYAIAANLAFMTNLIMPWFGYFALNWLGQAFTVIMVAFATYAIVKHKLMDIKLVLRKSFVYSASIVTIIIPTVFIKYVLNQKVSDWPSLLILIVSLSVFPKIRVYFFRIANKYFFSSLYDSQEVITSLNEKLRTSLDPQTIYKTTADTIKSTFHTKAVAILTYNEKEKSYLLRYNDGFTSDKKLFSGNHIIHKLFKNEHAILLDELKEAGYDKNSRTRDTIKILSDLNVELLCSLNLKGKTMGLVVLGEKETGEIYNKEDLRVLKIINTEVAIAIENSLLYEETKAFNITLTKQIAQATRKLRVQNKKLHSIDKIKTDFISTASHQLRTPLTATKWALSSVQKKCVKLDKTTKETFHDLTYSNEKLIKLVNELLNISRIDEGRLKIEPKPTDLIEMLKQMVKEYAPLVEQMKLKVITHYDKLPKINLDESVIQKALSNLVSNAIKYSRKGKKLTIEVKKDKTNAIIKVTDEGIGIPKAEQDGIFKKFYRASNAATSNTEGSGLGLYIAMQALKQSGGTVRFESKEDVGTTFYVTIPLAGSKEVKGEKGLV